MKYYFVYAYYCKILNGEVYGDAYYINEVYPSKELLKKEIIRDNPTCSAVVIMGITKMTEIELNLYWKK